MNKSSSPSRTYIAMCNNAHFDGYYFRKFILPEKEHGYEIENTSVRASWHFLNRLDYVACIEGCFPAEDLGSAAELVKWEPSSMVSPWDSHQFLDTNDKEHIG